MSIKHDLLYQIEGRTSYQPRNGRITTDPKASIDHSITGPDMLLMKTCYCTAFLWIAFVVPLIHEDEEANAG